MNKKVIIITKGNFPFGGPTANFLRNFAKSLSYAECEVMCISPIGFNYGHNVDNLKKRSGKVGDVSYRYLGFVNNPNNFFGKIINNLLGLVLPFFYILYRFPARRYSTVVVYNPFLGNMLSYLIVKIVFRMQLVIILPEFYDRPKKNKFSVPFLKWCSFYLSIKYLVRYGDKFIVLSNYLKEFLEGRFKNEKPILIIPNLTDADFFGDLSCSPFLENKYTIGYVGTPTNKDGVYDLIKSFSVIHKEFPQTHLLIIGDLTNGNSIIPSLTEYATNHGLTFNDITFTGLIPYKDVPGLLSSCQLLALTRPAGIASEAGFPSKLGEYFACKKPVLITSVGDIPFYFDDHKQVFMANPNDIDSIVNSMRIAIINKPLSDKVAQEGYLWMKNNLNYRGKAKTLSTFIFN